MGTVKGKQDSDHTPVTYGPGVFISSLNKLIVSLSGKLYTISLNDVKEKLGFPSNWLQIRDI